MKKLIISCLAIALFGITSSKAQGLLDKVDNALNKVDRASNTAERAGGTSGKVFNLLKKKKDKAGEKTGSQTTVHISGIDFPTLKKLNGNIQACEGVTDTKMKFNAATSTIIVDHTGATEDLLKLMEQTSKDIFTEQNLEGLEDGNISINLKNK
ncbi:hypothetical protein [Compostibacter hankyongensis]|uniref:DUF4252 domain-containing protein n=1 Tax=Compostibacter hankyongensis TaxID=1007089 RepID=A0ABP8FGD8_9BACT